MQMKNILVLAVLSAMAFGNALAEPIYVDTVAGLRQAVAEATSGAEIVLRASGSPYEFAETDFDTVGHLYARVRIVLRGETDDPSDVVLVGNRNRILYLADSNNRIRNLTFRDGDCTGYSTRSEEPYDQVRGGAIAMRKEDASTVISNCVFQGCKSKSGGGACGAYKANDTYAGVYQKCIFIGNETAGSGGALYYAHTVDDCRFLTNKATSATSLGGAICSAGTISKSFFFGNGLSWNGSISGSTAVGGGAVYVPANTKFAAVSIADCEFSGNSVGQQSGAAVRAAHTGVTVSRCSFLNNAATTGEGGGNGGALCDVSDVVECSIVSNAARFGGGAYNCRMSNCHMANNYAYRGGAAVDSVLCGCTNSANFSDDWNELGKKNVGCVAVDCLFSNLGSAGKKLFADSSFERCRFLNVTNGYLFANKVAMTNCLVACGGPFRFCQGLTVGSSMVNCTIVSNNYAMTSANEKVLTIENCLFFDNIISGTHVDVNENARTFVESFSHCILSASSDEHIPGSYNLNYYGDATFNPRFVGSQSDPENPFALQRRSPAVSKDGVVGDWMREATDIRGEGYPRLRDGKVDIGCYQCWIKPNGLMLIFR